MIVSIWPRYLHLLVLCNALLCTVWVWGWLLLIGCIPPPSTLHTVITHMTTYRGDTADTRQIQHSAVIHCDNIQPRHCTCGGVVMRHQLVCVCCCVCPAPAHVWDADAGMLCHWLAAVPPRAQPSIRALPLVRSIPSLPASGTSYWSASCRRKDTKYFVTSRKYLLHICSSSSRYYNIPMLVVAIISNLSACDIAAQSDIWTQSRYIVHCALSTWA